MRWVLGVAALVAAVLVGLSLQAPSARRTGALAGRPVPVLAEEGTPIPFDGREALRLAERLEALSQLEELPYAELQRAAATAAGWARSTPAGGGAYRAAVRLRGAANALLEASPSLADPRRDEARRLIAEARAALQAPAPVGGGPAGGIQDQLHNLQWSLEEQRRQVERE